MFEKIIKDSELRKSGLLLLLTLLPATIIYWDFIIFDKFYVFNDVGSDTFDSYWPFISDLHYKITSGELPFWSHNIGIGTNFYVANQFLTDIFLYLLVFVDNESIVYFFGYIVVLKIVFATFFFYKYISKFDLPYFACLIGSILYGFNGYIILWGQHYAFVNMLVYMPLLLLGLEFVLAKSGWKLFVFSVFLLAFNSYYFLFFITIFLALYAITRYFIINRFNVLNFMQFTLKLAGYYLLGIGLAAFIFIPAVIFVLQSPRISFNTIPTLFELNDFKYYFSTFFRLFSNNSLGINYEYSGFWNYYEDPILYSSLFTILLIPVAFRHFSKREKVMYGLLLIILLTFLSLPFFSSMFNAFNKVDYRWTFIIVFYNILLASLSLGNINNFDSKDFRALLATYGAIIVVYSGIVFYTDIFMDLLHDKTFQALFRSFMILCVFCVLYLIFFHFYIHSKKDKLIYPKIALCIVLLSEIVVNSYATVNERILVEADYKDGRQGYYDYTNEAVAFLKEYDKGFFRVKKDYFSRFYDDALVQKYNGLESYASFNHPSYIKFLSNLGVSLPSGPSIVTGVDERVNIETLLGVKYFLTRDEGNAPYNYKFIKKIQDIYIYENRNSLPVGFAYNSYIPFEEFNSLSNDEKDITLLQSAVLKSEIPQFHLNYKKYDGMIKKEKVPLDTSNITYNFIDVFNKYSPTEFNIITNHIDAQVYIPLEKETTSQLKITLNITSQQGATGQIFWKSKNKDFNEIDSKTFTIFPGSNLYEIHLGYIKDITQIRIDPSMTPGEYNIKNLLLESMDMEEYDKSIQALKGEEFHLKRFSNNSFEGKITVNGNRLLSLSIPYDKGWKAEVNGERVDIYSINNGLIGIPISQGTNNVKLSFTPPFLVLGSFISILSLFVVIIMIFWKVIMKKIGLKGQ